MPTYLVTEFYTYSCEKHIEADCEADALDIFDAELLVGGKDTYDFERMTIEEVED